MEVEYTIAAFCTSRGGCEFSVFGIGKQLVGIPTVNNLGVGASAIFTFDRQTGAGPNRHALYKEWLAENVSVVAAANWSPPPLKPYERTCES